MEVGDRFAAVRTIIDDQPEAGFMKALLTGNLLRHVEQVAQKRFVGVGTGRDAGYLLLRDDKEMDRSLRIDVVERQTEGRLRRRFWLGFGGQ